MGRSHQAKMLVSRELARERLDAPTARKAWRLAGRAWALGSRAVNREFTLWSGMPFRPAWRCWLLRRCVLPTQT